MKTLLSKYRYLQTKNSDAITEKVKEVLNNRAEAVKAHYPPENGLYECKSKSNVRVIHGGSQQKRDHASNLAVGVAIKDETGLVLDYETVSKYCEVSTKKNVNEESQKWMTEHKDKCKKKYEGSSGGMEAAAAVQMLCRSREKYEV